MTEVIRQEVFLKESEGFLINKTQTLSGWGKLCRQHSKLVQCQWSVDAASYQSMTLWERCPDMPVSMCPLFFKSVMWAIHNEWNNESIFRTLVFLLCWLQLIVCNNNNNNSNNNDIVGAVDYFNTAIFSEDTPKKQGYSPFFSSRFACMKNCLCS